MKLSSDLFEWTPVSDSDMQSVTCRGFLHDAAIYEKVKDLNHILIKSVETGQTIQFSNATAKFLTRSRVFQNEELKIRVQIL
jgi:hypothetical protein